MTLKRSLGMSSQSSLFQSPISSIHRMFYIRPTQRRNILLNILSLIGAYWIITTLFSLSNQNIVSYIIFHCNILSLINHLNGFFII